MSRSLTRRLAGLTYRGETLLVGSAIAFSSAGFFTRQAPVDLWAMVFWRNIFGAAALGLIILFTSRKLPPAKLRVGSQQCAVIALGSFGTICYLAAFKFTSVANISIIYATAPLISAFAAWVWLSEIVARKTLVASMFAVAGVSVTVGHSLDATTLFGDGLALLMTLALSLMAVAARDNSLPVLMTSLAASLAAAIAVLPLGWLDDASFGITGTQALWLAGFGILTMALALPAYLAGAADVPASRGMLIGAIEMPLAPFWVWLAFGETPSMATIGGGSVVALAVLYDLSPNVRFRTSRTSPAAPPHGASARRQPGKGDTPIRCE